LTRIQTALPKAAPDVQARVAPLVSDAEAKVKAKDGAGCDAATRQALQILQLPLLAPVRLSVPIVGQEGPDAATKAAAAAASPITVSPGAKATGSSTESAAPSQATGRGETQPDQAGGAAQVQPQPQATPPGPSQGSATSTQTAAPPPAAQAASAPEASDLTAGANAQEAPFFVSARDLLGVAVRDRDNRGRTLGWVGNLVLDRSTGRTEYVILESGGLLGWDRNRIVVPYNLLAFGGRWDRPALLVPASKIENAPSVRESDLVDLMSDPDWRRAIAVYFGTALADTASGASGASGASAPSGPRAVAAGTPAAADAAGHVSNPKAQPGEGATGPTASSGHPAASVTTTALATPDTGGGPDPKRGQAVVQRNCAACHTFNQGGPTRVGPNLFGVTERQIAEAPGYNYSPALKSHKGHWDESNLDAFLKSPRSFAPGTRMTFPGIGSDQDRRNVIAYLESLKPGAGASK
jgi:cytochrome c